MSVGSGGLLIILSFGLSAPLLLIFFLFTKAFKKDNKRAANTLAVIFSFWIFFYNILNSYFLADNIIFFILFFSLPLYGTFFVVGGIISTIYFSKYYGEIIIKVGIATHTIWSLVEILEIIVNFYSPTLLLNVFINILIISFWFIYFKTLSLKTDNISLVAKNDPKDW